MFFVFIEEKDIKVEKKIIYLVLFLIEMGYRNLTELISGDNCQILKYK